MSGVIIVDVHKVNQRVWAILCTSTIGLLYIAVDVHKAWGGLG